MLKAKPVHKRLNFGYDNLVQYRVDLNCDMGESFGAYTLGMDEEVIRSVTSANIACGFHASDPVVMANTAKLCKIHGVMAGAHPGYPDLLGFGRRSMGLSEREILDYTIYQVGALKGLLDFYDLPLQHVKLHGALYNYLVNEEDLAIAVASAVRKAFGDIIFVTLGTERTARLKDRCRMEGIRVALEAFPDRSYTDGGRLLSRNDKGAVLADHVLIAQRAVRMVKEGGVESVNGKFIRMDIDTLCIHGDSVAAVAAAGLLREYAAREGIEIRPLCAIV